MKTDREQFKKLITEKEGKERKYLAKSTKGDLMRFCNTTTFEGVFSSLIFKEILCLIHTQ